MNIWSYREVDDLLKDLPQNGKFEGVAHFIYGPANWIINKQAVLDDTLIGFETVIFTMNETTRTCGVEPFNKARAVITPSQWGLNCFSAQGFKSQLYVCPLGVDEALFEIPMRTPQDKLRFGCVATENRIPLEELLIGFAALPYLDAELEIICPDHPQRPQLGDKRVRYIDKQSKEDYHKWLESIDVGVCPSKGESFGTAMLEFAAAGKPVLSSDYGVMNEYLPVISDLKIRGKIVPANGEYKDQGHWFAPDIESITSRLDWACRSLTICTIFGHLFRENVKHLTWDNARSRLRQILQQEKLVI